MRVLGVALALLILTCLTPACGRAVDLADSLELHTISSGWIAAGAPDGKTKLVPTISFTLKNTSDQNLAMLQVNALFGRMGDEGEWGSSFLTAAGTKGLAPGEASSPLTATSSVGYTGLDSRAALMGHSQFVDARVNLFVKYGSARWARIGRYRIMRDLLAR